MSPLALLKEGETGQIVEACAGSGGCCGRHGRGQRHHAGDSLYYDLKETNRQDHLESMGLRPGKYVEMITNSGTGPLVLRVDECRIALGRGMAMKIYIRRNET